MAAASLALAACGDDPEPDPEPELAEKIFAPLGEIRPDATEEQRATFERGREVLLRRFSPEEGLGPHFNVAFCGACHESPVPGGGAPRYRDFYIVGDLLDDGTFIASGPRDGILHAYGTGRDGAPLRPTPPEGSHYARRNAIPFFGTGLIAEIYEDAILENADPDDRDGDGISGRPNFDQGFVGRFGRKAQTVSVEGFIRGPLNNHLGITSDPLDEDMRARLPVDSSLDGADGTRGGALTMVRQAQAAAPGTPLFDDDEVADPEMSTDDLFDLISFSMLLAAPEPEQPSEASMRGEALFDEVGCTSCHTPTLEAPRGLIPLYSDLLLHDMGDELGDGLEMGLATGNEFRTQPLWGVAAMPPYLHDGRADTLDEAIRYHGGEAEAVRDAYVALDDQDRSDVLAFLDSLGGGDEFSGGLLPPDAPVPDAGEAGGPYRDLSDNELAEFSAGRHLFDANAPRSDGLGPFFNGDSCRACHFDPVIGGAGPIDVNVMRFGEWEQDGFLVPAIGTILSKLSDSLLPRREQTGAHNTFEPRQTPTTMGLGLIMSIDDETILANADPEDEDGDGIAGMANVLADGTVGRFGWKAGIATVRDFVRDALSNEMGMTVPETDSMFGFLSDDDEIADPETSTETIDSMSFFIEMLAAPQPNADVPEGRAVFEDIGCASCHIPELEGSEGPVPLYSDLLLHDVAPDGYEGVPDGMVSGRQFRTAPLWGISDSAPYMHDGMASTVEEAILRHFAEGDASREAYEALGDADRESLIRFLEAL